MCFSYVVCTNQDRRVKNNKTINNNAPRELGWLGWFFGVGGGGKNRNYHHGKQGGPVNNNAVIGERCSTARSDGKSTYLNSLGDIPANNSREAIALADHRGPRTWPGWRDTGTPGSLVDKRERESGEGETYQKGELEGDNTRGLGSQGTCAGVRYPAVEPRRSRRRTGL